MGVINLGILIRKLSHVFLRKDDAATELSTLGFVKNTDYATGSTGGVIKIATAYGSSLTATGQLYGSARTSEQYDSAIGALLICKGTLENVKTDITARSLCDIAAAQITAPASGTYTVKLTYDGTAWGVTIIQDT